MAGGNFLNRVFSYVLNELLVDRLANSHAFQRFAVRTSKAMEEISLKGLQKKAAELKETLKNENNFKDQYKP